MVASPYAKDLRDAHCVNLPFECTAQFESYATTTMSSRPTKWRVLNGVIVIKIVAIQLLFFFSDISDDAK